MRKIGVLRPNSELAAWAGFVPRLPVTRHEWIRRVAASLDAYEAAPTTAPKGSNSKAQGAAGAALGRRPRNIVGSPNGARLGDETVNKALARPHVPRRLWDETEIKTEWPRLGILRTPVPPFSWR